MERKRQREIALGAAALVIVAIAAYRISTPASPTPGAATSSTTRGASGQQAANQKAPVNGVELDALHTERPEPVESRRNPFRFTQRTSPSPSPSQSSQPGSMPQIAPPPLPSGPVEPPPPPRIPLKFIGVMESGKAGKYAILSDGRALPIYGKEGQVIEGRYRILRIGVESIDLAYLDGRGRQTIRQTGQ
jgi:hypothetical protein